MSVQIQAWGNTVRTWDGLCRTVGSDMDSPISGSSSGFFNRNSCHLLAPSLVVVVGWNSIGFFCWKDRRNFIGGSIYLVINQYPYRKLQQSLFVNHNHTQTFFTFQICVTEIVPNTTTQLTLFTKFTGRTIGFNSFASIQSTNNVISVYEAYTRLKRFSWKAENSLPIVLGCPFIDGIFYKCMWIDGNLQCCM